MMPAPGASPPYRPSAASGDSSRNGDPGSKRVASRCRGSSLPRATCRWRAASGPPADAAAVFAASSATSRSWAATLARYSGDAGSACVPSTGRSATVVGTIAGPSAAGELGWPAFGGGPDPLGEVVGVDQRQLRRRLPLDGPPETVDQVGADRLADGPDGQRAAGGHLGRQSHGGGPQLVGRDQTVAEPDPQRLLPTGLAAGVQELPRPLLPDHRRQGDGGAEPVVEAEAGEVAVE